MVECALPALTMQPPAMMSTDLVGDRLAEPERPRKKRSRSHRRCARRRHRSALLDAPVARLDEGEACERDQTGRHGAEKPPTVGTVVELRERAVEADRLVRLVV